MIDPAALQNREALPLAGMLCGASLESNSSIFETKIEFILIFNASHASVKDPVISQTKPHSGIQEEP